MPTPCSAPSSEDARALRRALRAWYRRAARDLPWRATRDPYAIWISEALLQQTRAETVRERWARFLTRFPSLAALADADVEDVVAEWSGLGYYRRARNLHAAARVILAEHGGEFPRERAAAEALPGVGRYTAGAVLSIAHDLPEPLVDGNVERVFARWFGWREPAASAGLKAAAWRVAEQLVPRAGAGEWNQALMELGALVCTPRAPGCDGCPVRRRCRAAALGTPEQHPGPRVAAPTLDVELRVALVERGGRVLLERRPAEGRMAGLWQLPTRELRGGPGLFPADWPRGLELELGDPLGVLRHSITRHRIRATVARARARGRVPAPCAWFAPEEVASLGTTGMTRKALALGAQVTRPGRR